MITNLTILGRTDDPFVEYSTIDSSIIYRKCGYFFLVRVILDRLSNGDGIAEPDSVRFRFPPVETRLITAHAVIEPAFNLQDIRCIVRVHYPSNLPSLGHPLHSFLIFC